MYEVRGTHSLVLVGWWVIAPSGDIGPAVAGNLGAPSAQHNIDHATGPDFNGTLIWYPAASDDHLDHGRLPWHIARQYAGQLVAQWSGATAIIPVLSAAAIEHIIRTKQGASSARVVV